VSRQDNKKGPPVEPIEPHTEVPRSGAGAGTAMFAMLKKRQMRATRDAEPDPQPPPTPAGNNTGE
jgi:hypothetical protein